MARVVARSRSSRLLLCALFALLAIPAATASASVVVQVRQPGSKLLAHRYEAFATQPQTLTLVTQPNVDWTTLTLLDFDRDGRPDAMVTMDGNPGRTQVATKIWRLTPDAIAPSLTGGGTCFIPVPGQTAFDSGITVPGGYLPVSKRSSTWAVTLSADFASQFGANARYQPIVTTLFTDAVRSFANDHIVQDYLPDSAATGLSDTVCSGRVAGSTSYVSGMRVLPERGTDRGQLTAAPARHQVMLDRVDQGGGAPDLLEANVDQWNALQPTEDVTHDPINGTQGQFHPSDLVLSFTKDSLPSSLTYIIDPNEARPIGMVVTSPSTTPGQVRVELHLGLSNDLSGDRCYPRDAQTQLDTGSSWGAAPYLLDLPLTVDQGSGVQSVRVSLDRITRTYESGANDGSAFRWVTTSVPPSPSGEPDYLPDTATPAPASGACTFTGNGVASPGTTIYPSRAVRVQSSLPSVSLASSNASPPANSPVTLTATSDTATAFRFDTMATGVFDATTASNTRNASYPDNGVRTARVMVTNAAGVANMAATTITPAHAPPTADFSADSAAPYVLSTSGPTVTWTDHSSGTGTIASREWTLTSSHADHITGSGSTFSHTFAPGDSGDWTLTLKVTDDQGAPGTKTASFRVVQPPVAIIDSFVRDNGSAPCLGHGPIEYNQTFYACARVAADGSLGSEGPLTYLFDWRPDSAFSEYHPWNVPYGSWQYGIAGAFDVRMKVIDADGRESPPVTRQVNIRGVNELPPDASLVVSSGRLTGEDVTLDASGSVLNNPDASTAPATKFRYDFGDGSAPLDTAADMVTHTYAGSGPYTPSVIAYDDRNLGTISASDPATADLRISQGPQDTNAPVPALTRSSPQGTVFAKREVIFSAAATHVTTAPAHYAWDLDGSGHFATDTGTQATLSTTYADQGNRSVRVRVTDGEGRVATSAPIVVNVAPAPDLAPVVHLSAPASVTVSGGTASAALDATGSTGLNPDPSLSYRWDLDGDGVYETNTGASAQATATFSLPGEYTVRVRATDVYGNSAVAEATIIVHSQADIAAGCIGTEQYRPIIFGRVRVSSCWTKVPRPNAGPLWIGRGDVDLNGLRMTAGTGTAHAPAAKFDDCSGACIAAQANFNRASDVARLVALDPHSGQLTSNYPVSMRAQGSGIDLPLIDAPIDVTLPAASSSDGIVVHPPGGFKLLTLTIGDKAEIKFPTPGTSTIGLSIHMPPQMPGASADVTLRTAEGQGVILDKLKAEVTAGLFADKIKFGKLSIEYSRPDKLWAGSAEFGLPAIKKKELGLAMALKIQDDTFKSIYGAVSGLEIELGEGIFLQSIRLGIAVNPVDLQGGMGISAGPMVLGKQILSADGDLRITFPSGAHPYTLFQVSGGTKLLDFLDLSKGVLRFATNGFVEARGGISRASVIGYFDASVGGWLTRDAINLSGDAEAGLLVLGDRIKLLGAHAVLSSRGTAACGEIPVLKLAGGVGYRWGQKVDTFVGCDLGPYSEARPAGIPDGFDIGQVGTKVRAAKPKVPTLTLPAGLRSVGVTVHGAGGPPRVRLVDSHAKVVLDARAEQLTPGALVLQDQQTATTQILWKAPPKGRYAVIAEPGSPAVDKVQQALDAGPQVIHATVSGTGPQRTLRWRVSPGLQRGQRLVLSEQLRGGGTLDGTPAVAGTGGAGHLIVTTTRSKGSAHFKPQAGNAEARVVIATIETDGLGRPPVLAARFTAPRAERPASPVGVKLLRRGRTAVVTWSARRGSTPSGGWLVDMRAGGLRSVRTAVLGGRRRYVLREIPAELPVTAKIAGRTLSGTIGAARKASLAAGASRSGAGASDAQPRRLTARRHGRTLVVAWKPGGEVVRDYVVVVHIGRRVVRLHAHPSKPKITVRGLPRARTAVVVEVRGERFSGATSPPARVSGGR
jgi:hypothetical protein